MVRSGSGATTARADAGRDAIAVGLLVLALLLQLGVAAPHAAAQPARDQLAPLAEALWGVAAP